MMMKRKGIHKPTIEDAIEISGIETLHPGGFDLTRRTAEVAELKPGMRVLDVSSGRGTQAIFYAENYGVQVTGIDISEKMIQSATDSAQRSGNTDRVSFRLGDSRALPFSDNSFDAVINECAVGIPDDSQQVLNEMVRVVKPRGTVVIHESIWKKRISDMEKEELSERYGTTPLELEEWNHMLQKAGVVNITSEHEEWSKPERVVTLKRILQKHGISGVTKVMENEKVFFKAVMDGKIGYGLYRGVKGDIHGNR
ncbi:class I SAM-dependent methyltransferase [Paenibacillus albidus]|uniref:class I SAM-dependent methyltransferase n=1 Tax=Paenibacillus albidus TaxID=2041023 RepID=UPI001BE857C3|nr:methyltransferase domain-containing protein [Paenibacillus albidus]